MQAVRAMQGWNLILSLLKMLMSVSLYIYEFILILNTTVLKCLSEVKWKSLSHVRLFVTPGTIQSLEFSRPEYWSGYAFPSPGNLSNPGLLHCMWILYQLSYMEPNCKETLSKERFTWQSIPMTQDNLETPRLDAHLWTWRVGVSI